MGAGAAEGRPSGRHPHARLDEHRQRQSGGAGRRRGGSTGAGRVRTGPRIVEAWCIVYVMPHVFGIVGALAAVGYWRYVIFVEPLPLPVHWSNLVPEILIYAAVGYVVGWVLGVLVRKIERRQ